MTLLSPMSALIAGAVAGPLLLLLYLLRLRRKAVRVTSTMLWQETLGDLQANVPWRWIRPSWLFWLQLAALSCLVIAAGRPAFNMNAGEHERVLILIDRSASMNTVDVPDRGTRLDRAKEQARLLARNVTRAGKGGRVAIAVYAASATLLQSFTRSADTAIDAIETISPSDQPDRLATAGELLSALAAGGGGAGEEDEAPITIYFLTDGNTSPGEPDTKMPLPRSMRARFVRIPVVRDGGGSEVVPENAGIVSLAARRDQDDPSTWRVTTRIISNAPATRTLSLRITLDGVSVGVAPVTVPGAGLVDGRWVPGETTATTAVRDARSESDQTQGVLGVTILNDDALACDNRAWAVIDRLGPPRLLMVSPGARGVDADPFLRGYLEAAAKDRSRVVDRSEFTRLMSDAGRPIEQFDLVMFDRVLPEKWPAVPTLSFGVDVPPIGVRVVGDTGATPPRRFVTWSRQHPLLRDVNLEPIELRSSRVLTLGGATPATPLVEAPGGVALALGTDAGGIDRAAWALGVGDTTWGADVSFLVFLSNVIDTVTIRGTGVGSVAETTTSPIAVRVRGGVQELRLTRRADAGGTAVPRVVPLGASPDEWRDVAVGVFERVGVYEVDGADRPLAAANLFDARESALRTSEELPIRGTTGAAARADAPPREVWDRFVLAAVVLLMIEWLLYAARMRG